MVQNSRKTITSRIGWGKLPPVVKGPPLFCLSFLIQRATPTLCSQEPLMAGDNCSKTARDYTLPTSLWERRGHFVFMGAARIRGPGPVPGGVRPPQGGLAPPCWPFTSCFSPVTFTFVCASTRQLGLVVINGLVWCAGTIC